MSTRAQAFKFKEMTRLQPVIFSGSKDIALKPISQPTKDIVKEMKRLSKQDIFIAE
jgi:hypothetical protein